MDTGALARFCLHTGENAYLQPGQATRLLCAGTHAVASIYLLPRQGLMDCRAQQPWFQATSIPNLFDDQNGYLHRAECSCMKGPFSAR